MERIARFPGGEKRRILSRLWLSWFFSVPFFRFLLGFSRSVLFPPNKAEDFVMDIPGTSGGHSGGHSGVKNFSQVYKTKEKQHDPKAWKPMTPGDFEKVKDRKTSG